MSEQAVSEIEEIIRLSPSDAKTLLAKSPLHCWQNKRQLGGGRNRSTEATEEGKILEALIFGTEADLFEIHDVPNWQSAHAKGLKASSVQKNLIPMRKDDYGESADAAMKILANIRAAGIAFEQGTPQKEIIWIKETVNGPVECHGFLDYLIIGPDYYLIYDLKCVADADLDSVTRAMTNFGWDIQAAAYVEGVEANYPHLAGRGKFLDVFCEKSAPFAVNVPEMSGAFRTLGQRKWDRAAGIWARCMSDNFWPGYSGGLMEPLPWQMAKETEGGE